MYTLYDVLDSYNDYFKAAKVDKGNVINFVEKYCSDYLQLHEIETMFSKIVFEKTDIKWYIMMDVLLKYHPDFFSKHVKLNKVLYKNLLNQNIDTESFIKYNEVKSILECYLLGVCSKQHVRKAPFISYTTPNIRYFFQDSNLTLFVESISKLYKYLFLLSEVRVFQYVSFKGMYKRRYNGIFETECKEYFAFKYWKMYLNYKLFIRNVIKEYIRLEEHDKAVTILDTIIHILKKEDNYPLVYATICELKRNKDLVNTNKFHNVFKSYLDVREEKGNRTKYALFEEATKIIILFQIADSTFEKADIYKRIEETKNEIISTKAYVTFNISHMDIDVYDLLLRPKV